LQYFIELNNDNLYLVAPEVNVMHLFLDIYLLRN
jgi:hypothetical protein